MLSFSAHSRRSHFSWGKNDLEIHDEVREELIKSAEHGDHIDDFDMSNEHFADFLDHHEALNDTEHYHIDQYKRGSDFYNIPLRRSSARHEGHIALTSVPDRLPHLIHPYNAMDIATSHETRHAAHLYRGFSGFPIHELRPGRMFTDHGYTGTSTKVNVARYHSTATEHENGYYDVIAKIHAPVGTKMHFLDCKGGIHSREQEVLLHRGTKFHVMHHEIIKDKHDDLSEGIHLVHLNVVGQYPKKLISRT